LDADLNNWDVEALIDKLDGGNAVAGVVLEHLLQNECLRENPA
jgi:hypothetical protein